MKKFAILFSLFIFFHSIMIYATGEESIPEIKLRLHLIPLSDKLEIELIAENESNQDIHLQFPTTKMYDFTIYDSHNKKVYQFSDKRFFLQAIQNIIIKKGEQKVWKTKWDYKVGDEPLQEGAFIIKAALLPSKINDELPSYHIMDEQEFFIPVVKHFNYKYTGDIITLSGKLLSLNKKYTYTVDDGHNILVKKSPIPVSTTKDFSLKIKKPSSDKQSLIFTIYNSKNEPIFVESIKTP